MSDPRHPYRDYPRKAGATARTRASAAALWEVVTHVGGENRYFALDFLWTVREWMDAAVGGPGLKRGRTTQGPLRPGDRIDSWEVLVAEHQSVLALRFNMKAPGDGALEFRIDPFHGGAAITVTAWWRPKGTAGALYWAAMLPAHVVLFKRMTAEICRRAEALEQGGAETLGVEDLAEGGGLSAARG